MEKDLRSAALEYHRYPTHGKISVTPTKGLTNQRDLALAYSPGVAFACEEIEANPDEADTLGITRHRARELAAVRHPRRAGREGLVTQDEVLERVEGP